MVTHDYFDLQKAIKKAREGVKSFSAEEYVKIAFIKPGKHKIRFFHDPDGDIFRYVMSHQFPGRKKTHCPNYLREQNPSLTDLPGCEICKLADEIDNWRSKLGRRYSAMIYGHLYETNSADEYWQPGTTYIVVGSGKLRDAVLAFLEGLVSDASDYIQAMLNPNVNGGVVSVEVTGGTQGAINLSAIPGVTKPPIELGSWYKPLAESWISKEFSQSDYQEALEAAKARAKEFLESTSTSAPSTSDVESTPSDTPVAQPQPQQSSTSELPQNSVMSKLGKIIELPARVIQLQCWTKFNQQDKDCLQCPISMECMFEGSILNK